MSAEFCGVMNWEVFFPPHSHVVALPSWTCPRLLVPTDTILARVSGGAFYPAFRITGRLYRVLLRLKALSGVGSKCSAYRGPSLLEEFLRDVLPTVRVQAVQIGIPGRARKFTVQLADDSGRVIGYLKCANSPLARERLSHELQLLLKLPAGAGPVPVKYGSMNGYDVVLLSAVCGNTLKVSVSPPSQLRDFSNSLSGADRFSLEMHPWVRATAAHAAEMAESLEALAGREWPVTIQHGDLAPWNLIQNRAGHLTAIDWEYGVDCGFPGLDLAQYVLQVAALICRWGPERAREYAIQQLQRDDHLRLTCRESAAMVALAANQAYHNAAADGHAPQHPIQTWRRAIWGHRV